MLRCSMTPDGFNAAEMFHVSECGVLEWEVRRFDILAASVPLLVTSYQVPLIPCLCATRRQPFWRDIHFPTGYYKSHSAASLSDLEEDSLSPSSHTPSKKYSLREPVPSRLEHFS